MEYYWSVVDKGITVEQGLFPTTYRFNFTVPDPAPKVSIIIPAYNGKAILRVCIGSILAKTRYSKYEIVIIDNNSDEPAPPDYLAALAENSDIRVLAYPNKCNDGAINNLSVDNVDG